MKTRNRYTMVVFSVGLPLVLIFMLGMGIQRTEAKDLNQSLPDVTSTDHVISFTQAAGNLTRLDHTSEIAFTPAFAAYLPAIYHNYESPYLEKVYTTPDYLQTDPAYGGLPGGGRMYCGPVAVSNSLMWLDDNGYDSLAPNTNDSRKDQFDLICLLGSSDYMNTSLMNGTGVNSLLNGVDRFIQDKGYQYVRLQYQGWRYHNPRFSTGVDVPNLEWIKQGIRGNSSAWLNYGKYTYDAVSDEYTRTGGHWVTLVGYGYDSSLANPTYLVIHDPAWGDGSSITNLYLLLEEIDSGTLVGNYTGLPRSAIGFCRVTTSTYVGANNADLDMHIASENADFRILDGVVVMEMPMRATSVDISLAAPSLGDVYTNEGN